MSDLELINDILGNILTAMAELSDDLKILRHRRIL